MNIKSVDYLKNHSDEILDLVNENHETIIITKNDEARAVIQDISSYEKFRKAFFLLKFLARGEKDYQEGKVISHNELKKQMENKLKNLQNVDR
ncbi:type II toxin-antitoxin system Phd/YefM family antitoxin [candidate division KSB1 bacterium]|nr:type II toxin-antitoxin system Phd/YefM family antitoxin [candidate division KSB1 bacterium]MBL7093723.1 type II toxin-antitoxin system Phd/YefM family antitoxin [candidate division KSB1 bacterium]